MITWCAAVLMTTSAMAGKWDGAEADVRMTKLLEAPPKEIHLQLDDLREWGALWPEDCATQFSYSAITTGEEALGAVRYTFGPLRRRLDMKISRDEPGHVFEIEHPGNRGWFTQITYRPVDDGTEVAIFTPLNPPPWPFKSVFFKKVRPAMLDCHGRWLDALAAAVTAADASPSE
ncbi:MAG: hypothetical protein AAGA48_26755 [Myxococcota bacterium]